MKFHDGRKYEGKYENNQPNGDGILTFSNGTLFVGNFKNGKFHGAGKMVADDGDVIREGQWVDGLFKDE